MLSAQGGVEIEAVAESDPDAIAKIWIDPVLGLTDEVARDWVAAAELNPAATEGAVDILTKLYTAYTEGDADLTEINPLILKPTGEVHALGAKVTLRRRRAPPRGPSARPPSARHCAEPQPEGLQYVGLGSTAASSPTAPGSPCRPSTSSTTAA